MNNYPLGDFLIQLKNAHSAGKEAVVVPWSRNKEIVAKLLVKHGFLKKVEVKKQRGKSYPLLSVTLPPKAKLPLWQVKLYSKPGRRFYAKTSQLPYPQRRGGLVIVSTPAGMMSAFKARQKGLGGEVIASLW